MCHHAPAVILACSAIQRTLGGQTWLWESAVWAGIDVWAGWMMVKLLSSLRRQAKEQDVRARDLTVAAAYLLNPYIILTNIAHSTSSPTNALTLTTLYHALNLQHSLSFEAVIAGVATMLLGGGFHAALIVVPTMVMLTFPNLRLFTAFFVVALTVAGALIQQELFPGYLTSVLLTPLTSNLDARPDTALWWYFHIRIFVTFRDFFTCISSLHLVIYIVPLCIKLGNSDQQQQQPLILPTALAGIIAAFGTYPFLADTALPLYLLSFSPATLSYLAHPFLTLLVLISSSILLPVFGELWLGRGIGNANFGWAVGMVWVLGQLWGVVDLVGAGVRVRWDEEGGRVGEKRRGEKAVQIYDKRDGIDGKDKTGWDKNTVYPVAGFLCQPSSRISGGYDSTFTDPPG
ncbi:hypothetical protein YB2330_001969 [Saitoella coloradoensis]